MRLVLATNHLGLGGSESYLLTVAEQLQRLGHDVHLFSLEVGRGAEVARERGIELVSEAALPAECDAALVQDGAVSYHLAAHYPMVPQLFVAHSEIFDLQAPPQLPDIVGAVVAMNERVAARLAAFPAAVEIVRLTQPIDTDHFTPPGPPLPLAKRALLLSNNAVGDRLEMIESACRTAGLELVRMGGVGGRTTDPRSSLLSADIVIGYGRSVLEAMACGRAAYVYDWSGGEGWVTGESYPGIEAQGFGGRSGDSILDGAAMAEDLRRYEPTMGVVNHDLVMAHHRANVHAQRLVEIFESLAEPVRRPRAQLEEMARLVRLEWGARFEAGGLRHENGQLRTQLRSTEEMVHAEHRRGLERVAESVTEREAAVRKEFEDSASWRLTAPLRAVFAFLRRLRSAQPRSSR